MKCIAAILFVALSCVVASARAEEVAVPPIGKSVEIKSWDELPAYLRETVKRDCPKDWEWSIELYGTDAVHDFALLHCSGGIAWYSKLYRIRSGRAEALQLEGKLEYQEENPIVNLGMTWLDGADGTITSEFSDDTCGLPQENPVNEYRFINGQYELTEVAMLDCNTNKNRTVWKRK